MPTARQNLPPPCGPKRGLARQELRAVIEQVSEEKWLRHNDKPAPEAQRKPRNRRVDAAFCCGCLHPISIFSQHFIGGDEQYREKFAESRSKKLAHFSCGRK
jgi:hypothetical protein